MSVESPLRLGFAPLNDAAALIVARAKGFFVAEGLSVNLSREASWATVRDKLSVGALDGAHLLAPLAVAMTLGAGCEPAPMVAPLALNRGGAAVTISTRLGATVDAEHAGERLAALIARRRDQDSTPLTFGVVFPYAIHNYLLRDWLARLGVDPDRDVRLTVVAPARTADMLAEGVIEGFCAGEPWGQVAARAGVGRIVARASRLAPHAPDKVFAVTAAWAAAHEAQLQALLRALLRASSWIERPENRRELVALLARPEHLDVEADAVEAGLADIDFHRDGANRPDPEQARWIVAEMARWGQLAPPAETAAATAARVYRPDLFEQARIAVGA